MDSYPTYIFFGRSGAGKGTQSLLLEAELKKRGMNVLYIETGKKFREFLDDNSYTSDKAKEYMEKGKLLPPFLPVWIWSREFIEKYQGNEALILDGLCRAPSEAPILDSAMKFYERSKPYVIYINTSRAWSFDRLKGRGRNDDTDEYIKSRLDWFDWNVIPSMSFFHDNPGYTFVEINGEQTIEQVHADIKHAVGLE